MRSNPFSGVTDFRGHTPAKKKTRRPSIRGSPGFESQTTPHKEAQVKGAKASLPNGAIRRRPFAQLESTHPTVEGTPTHPCVCRQVFWLSDRSTGRAFSTGKLRHSAGGLSREWHWAAFVPDHSGGSTVDSHHLPSWSVTRRTPATATNILIYMLELDLN